MFIIDSLTFPRTSSEHTIKWKPVKCTRWYEWATTKIRYFCNSTGYSNQFKLLYATSPIADTWSVAEFPKWQNRNDHIRPHTKLRMSIPKTTGSNSDWNAFDWSATVLIIFYVHLFDIGICKYEVFLTCSIKYMDELNTNTFAGRSMNIMPLFISPAKHKILSEKICRRIE